MNKLFIAEEYVFGIFISYSPSNNISAGITLKIWKTAKILFTLFSNCVIWKIVLLLLHPEVNTPPTLTQFIIHYIAHGFHTEEQHIYIYVQPLKV